MARRIRTFLDSGVLISAARSRGPDQEAALAIPDDPARLFLATPFNDGEARILRNTGHANHHWLVVDTRSTIGASVRVATAVGTQHGFVNHRGQLPVGVGPTSAFRPGGP